MNQITQALRQLIDIDDDEVYNLLSRCREATFESRDFLSRQGEVSNDIFFLCKGLTRSVIVDQRGEEHTIHFSLENQFVSDYTSFMLRTPANNGLQALERTTVVVIPRAAVEWGYAHLREGNKLGRLIAEYYFIYFDNRIKNQYYFSPAERYEHITKVFPNIHNRAPQHMIASYLGISPVHLSRLKKQSRAL